MGVLPLARHGVAHDVDLEQTRVAVQVQHGLQHAAVCLDAADDDVLCARSLELVPHTLQHAERRFADGRSGQRDLRHGATQLCGILLSHNHWNVLCGTNNALREMLY